MAVLKSGTSRDKSPMVLLRYLTMLAIRHSFSFTASSVQGEDNPVADALSRFQFQRFRRLVPHADATPSPIPASLLAALHIPRLRSVSSFLPKVLHLPPDNCTIQLNVDFSTVAARTVVLTRMAPSPQQMRRLSGALHLSWQTT